MSDDRPAFTIRRGGKIKDVVNEYLGYVEVWTDSKIKGWALHRLGDAYSPTTVIVEGSRQSVRGEARLERSDLYRQFGTDGGGFEFDIDRSIIGKVERVYFADTNGNISRVSANAAIDRFDGPLIRGWASDESQTVVDVDLYIDQKKEKTVSCDTMRPELFGDVGSRACIGFTMRIPGKFRAKEVHEIELKVAGNAISQPMFKRFGPLRVLIVSESEVWEDASRYYRCDNLKLMLNMKGLEASVIGANEFHEKNWTNFDVVVMARVKMTDELEKKILQYRRLYRTVFVFEIDDMIFLPWQINDMGSVRSGVDTKDNPDIERMFASRLRSIKLCDFGITTTPNIATKLSDLGLNTIIVPNALRIEQIEETKARTSVLQILCMAGSPTHFADFATIEHEIRMFMERNRNTAKLTLLGRFKEGQPILKLPNVTVIARQPYTDMLETIGKHDVCLVPLETTEFNHAKSCLKFIECGSRMVPLIASPTDDYIRAIRNGENGFIARKPGDWTKYLDLLMADRKLLRDIGEKAREDVINHYTIPALADRVSDWFINEVAA